MQLDISVQQWWSDNEGHTSTCHEGKKREVDLLLYSFFNLGGRWGWVVIATSRSLYPREWSGTHRTGDRLGPRRGLDGCAKCRPPTGVRFSPQRAAIPTEPSRTMGRYRRGGKKTNCSEKNPCQCHFVHFKNHADQVGIDPWSPLCVAVHEDDWCPFQLYIFSSHLTEKEHRPCPIKRPVS